VILVLQNPDIEYAALQMSLENYAVTHSEQQF